MSFCTKAKDSWETVADLHIQLHVSETKDWKDENNKLNENYVP